VIRYAGLLAVILCVGCATTKQNYVGPSPLVIASCPDLTLVTDKAFGTTVQALIDTSIQYRKCQAAALAGQEQ
jgi:hypothetical protein